jgi:hypothetical protein
VQEAFVRRELLKRADAAAGAQDRDEIPRPDLFVHELRQRVAGTCHALEREAEVIDHDRHDAGIGRG